MREGCGDLEDEVFHYRVEEDEHYHLSPRSTGKTTNMQ